jgi:hypothetical protein
VIAIAVDVDEHDAPLVQLLTEVAQVGEAVVELVLAQTTTRTPREAASLRASEMSASRSLIWLVMRPCTTKDIRAGAPSATMIARITTESINSITVKPPAMRRATPMAAGLDPDGWLERTEDIMAADPFST